MMRTDAGEEGSHLSRDFKEDEGRGHRIHRAQAKLKEGRAENSDVDFANGRKHGKDVSDLIFLALSS